MTKSKEDSLLAVTIAISTFNRAKILQNTLLKLSELKCGTTQVKVIVVDNNSNDSTRQICSSFENKLPLEYIFEKRPGKNRALNTIIETADLGDIVIFTDDDVAPPTDWIAHVANSTKAFPETKVFGGPVHLIWPKEVPTWCKSLEKVIYAQHDYGDANVPYSPGHYPIGPNFWVRTEIFTVHGQRYDTSIGPIPNNRKRAMGSETTFLKTLAEKGFTIQYIAGCSVGHYVTEEQLKPSYIRRRAKTYGRFKARVSTRFHQEALYKKSILLWKASRWISLTKNSILMLISLFYANPEKRYLKQVNACRWLAFNQTYIFSHKEIWAQYSRSQQQSHGK